MFVLHAFDLVAGDAEVIAVLEGNTGRDAGRDGGGLAEHRAARCGDLGLGSGVFGLGNIGGPFGSGFGCDGFVAGFLRTLATGKRGEQGQGNDQ